MGHTKGNRLKDFVCDLLKGIQLKIVKKILVTTLEFIHKVIWLITLV